VSRIISPALDHATLFSASAYGDTRAVGKLDPVYFECGRTPLVGTSLMSEDEVAGDGPKGAVVPVIDARASNGRVRVRRPRHAQSDRAEFDAGSLSFRSRSTPRSLRPHASAGQLLEFDLP